MEQLSRDPRSLVIREARRLIGQATYRLAARLEEAPEIVNCMTLLAHSYRVIGLELAAARFEEQLAQGKAIDLNQLEPGDLIYTAGSQAYYDHPEYCGIGHVGLATGEGTVVHATRRVRQGRVGGVYEDPLTTFIAAGAFKVARRLLTPTLQPPCLVTKGIVSHL